MTPEPVVRTGTAAPAPKTPEVGPTHAQAEILDLPDTQEMLARAGARAPRTKIMTGVVVAVVLVVAIVGGIIALGSSGTKTPPPAGGTRESAQNPTPASTSPAPAAAPSGIPVAPAAITSPRPTGAAGSAAPTSPTPPGPPRASSRRQRSSAEAVKALTGEGEDDSKAVPGKPPRSRPSTPAELKDPFNSQ